MSGRRYVTESSVKAISFGGRSGGNYVELTPSAPLKEVVSRVLKNPKGKFVAASCLVNSGSGYESADLRVSEVKSFSLPSGAVNLTLWFCKRTTKKDNIEGKVVGCENLSVSIDFRESKIGIIGSLDTVVGLCSWLNVQISEIS